MGFTGLGMVEEEWVGFVSFFTPFNPQKRL